jgi:ribosomal protein L7Ae-like RNA K-turn-binding protein
VGKDEEALLLLAADVVPFKRLIHLPIACEEYRPRIPYIFIRHQFHLGATMCVFLFFF